MLPSLFVAHGSPLLATDPVRGEPLRQWGYALPRPTAILAVSAHWEASPLSLSAVTPKALEYDFWGFPPELYKVRYAPPPTPALADRVVTLLAGRPIARTERGLDHGVWTPLLHLFPKADVPVLQLSMPLSLDAAALFALGQALRPLRSEGVLILCSGNLVHNLRLVDFDENGPPEFWAADFDTWIGNVLMRRDWESLLDYRRKSPQLKMAHPTEEHFRPVLVAAGAADDAPVSFPLIGWEMGSVSRRSVQFG